MEPSNSRGHVSFAGGVGTVQLRTRAKPYATQKAFQQRHAELREQHGEDWQAIRAAVESMMVDLPPATLPPGANDEPIVIRLPEEWAR